MKTQAHREGESNLKWRDGTGGEGRREWGQRNWELGGKLGKLNNKLLLHH